MRFLFRKRKVGAQDGGADMDRQEQPEKIEEAHAPSEFYGTIGGGMFEPVPTLVPDTINDSKWATRVHKIDCTVDIPRQIYISTGTPTLQRLAVDCIIENLTNIPPESIERFPLHIVDQVWAAISSEKRLSFELWKAFVKVLSKETPTSLSTLRYRQKIDEPRSSLSAYTIPLTSTSFEFITSLTIITSFNVPELLRLSSLKNLGVLEIIHHMDWLHAGVSDRLIRSWSEDASRNDSFGVLRILKLWDHDEVTLNSLGYLNNFPALAVYDIRSKGFVPPDTVNEIAQGWKATARSDVRGLLEEACFERVKNMLRAVHDTTKLVERVSTVQLADNATVTRLPRKEIPAFLTHSQIHMQSIQPLEHARKSTLESTTMHTNANVQKDLPSIIIRPRQPPMWDFGNTTMYTRLGELRNDSDLAKAGIDIGDQAIVGKELVNSTPLVSICLGSNSAALSSRQYDNSHKWSYGGTVLKSFQGISSNTQRNRKLMGITQPSLPYPRNFTFCRINAPPPSRNTEEEAVSVPRSPPSKRPNSGNKLKKGKRRNLGDVLSLFN